DLHTASADEAVTAEPGARVTVQLGEGHRGGDTHADTSRDRDREHRRVRVVGRLHVEVADRSAARAGADGHIADFGASASLDLDVGDRGASREGTGAEEDREGLHVALGVREDIDAAAGLQDQRSVVDVRVLRAGVPHDDHLGADADEATDARERDRGDVLIEVRIHEDHVTATGARRDARARSDLRLGLAVDGQDQDRRADADEATSYRTGEADDFELVVRADPDAVAGDDRAVDRREGAIRNGGRRRDRAARDVGARCGRATGDAVGGPRGARADARVRAAVALVLVFEVRPTCGVHGWVQRRARGHVDLRLVVDIVEDDDRAGTVGRARRPCGGLGRRARSHEDVLEAGRSVGVVVAGRDLVGALLRALTALRRRLPLRGVTGRPCSDGGAVGGAAAEGAFAVGAAAHAVVLPVDRVLYDVTAVVVRRCAPVAQVGRLGERVRRSLPVVRVRSVGRAELRPLDLRDVLLSADRDHVALVVLALLIRHEDKGLAGLTRGVVIDD